MTGDWTDDAAVKAARVALLQAIAAWQALAPPAGTRVARPLTVADVTALQRIRTAEVAYQQARVEAREQRHRTI